MNRAPSLGDEINWEYIEDYSAKKEYKKVFFGNNIDEGSYFDLMTNYDFRTLLPALLQVEDRMSMAHGLESRVPLLDVDLVEFSSTIPANIKFDLIYLDGFSPQKCPQVWSVEFLAKVTQKLNPQGYLITYSCSAAIRRTLKDLGFNIFNIKPNSLSKNLWSNGTIAVKIIEEKVLQSNLYFKKLSSMEEEHLLTKASIPYRDPNLSSNPKDIIQKRVKEQLLSNLNTSKKWRDKWGMTK